MSIRVAIAVALSLVTTGPSLASAQRDCLEFDSAGNCVKKRRPPRPRHGWVSIAPGNNSAGATVYVGGEAKGSLSPSRPLVLRLAPGTYRVRVEKQGYEPFATDIEVSRRNTRRRPVTVRADLVQQTAIEVVAANPDARGGQIWVGGGRRGSVPAVVPVPPGTHIVEVRRPGFEATVHSLKVGRGERAVVRVELRPRLTTGSMAVQTNVEGALIYLDGRLQEIRAPGVLTDIPAGEHIVEIRKDGHTPARQTAAVEAGKTTRVELVLSRSAPEVVKVKVRAVSTTGGEILGAEVAINYRHQGRTPFSGELEPGTYALAIRKAGYEPFAQTIRVARGGSFELTGRLRPSSEPRPSTTATAESPKERRLAFWGTGREKVSGNLLLRYLRGVGDGEGRTVLGLRSGGTAGTYEFAAGADVGFGGSLPFQLGLEARFGLNLLSWPRADRVTLSVVNLSVGGYGRAGMFGYGEGSVLFASAGGHFANTTYLTCRLGLRLVAEIPLGSAQTSSSEGSLVVDEPVTIGGALVVAFVGGANCRELE